LRTLDLHGVLHEDAEFIIEKFITDNFAKLPVKIITGHSSFFKEEVRRCALKYELGRQPESFYNSGAWIIYEFEWQKK
jgi:hypothetical protein